MTMAKTLDSANSRHNLGIPKLEDANMAGTQESFKCTLILTEGDSAKALVMVGLTKVGKDYYGVFPLCGKLLNVRKASPARVKGNKEIINICKILGLNSKEDNLDTTKLLHFKPMQVDEHQIVNLAFSKHEADARKEWLHQYYPDTNIIKSNDSISYTEFINKELIQFSMAFNICNIPSVVDGLNPSQRKIVYCCFLRPDNVVNVVTLSGSIIEKLAYHHGNKSLALTIIRLAQNFVGANNVNLLTPLGQFGSQAQGGKDADAAHYINVCLPPITKMLFNKNDMPLLNYLDAEGMKVEPECFVPVMPIILMNGCVGTDLAFNLRWLMHGESLITMMPWYLWFTGKIEPTGPNCYTVYGCINKLDNQRFEITELPIGVWTQKYDEMLEDWRCNSDMIEDYKKHHTDLSVRYIIWVSDASMKNLEKEDLYAKFKLKKTIYTSNLILKEFYKICLQFYQKRKKNLESKLKQEYTKISNQVRFILAVNNKHQLIHQLKKKSKETKPKALAFFDSASN
ncbi:DNA topoisomerase 2 [Massospora cicadina]|nr:DNA topoisomerase 2 [Massospora cicadina]